ncbi:MAG: hotdog fold thioesterase [Bacteroidia bacterium]|nr:hotdog fold thioesterase [Bacteroidia bacterium]
MYSSLSLGCYTGCYDILSLLDNFIAMKKEELMHLFSGIEDKIPFHKALGLKVDQMEKGKVRFYLSFKEEFIGNYLQRFYHGGVLSAAMDGAAGAAAGSYLFPSKSMGTLSTMDIRIDYMKPVKDQDIHVHAEVTSAGKRSIFVRMYVTYVNDTKVLVEGRAVMNVRQSDPNPIN